MPPKLTIALLLLYAVSSHAVKDTRVWVHNDAAVTLFVYSIRGPHITLQPGEQTSYVSNVQPQVYVHRWCPTTSSQYRWVRRRACFWCIAHSSQVMTLQGDNPIIGYPTLKLWGNSGASTSDLKFSEGESKDCSATKDGHGFSTWCWRSADTTEKNMHVSIKTPPKGCATGWGQPDCPDIQEYKDICDKGGL